MFYENKSEDSSIVSDDALVSNNDKRFLDDEIFQRLLIVREEVYRVTDVSPAIRKLVNLIIEKADLKAIQDQLIKQYS